MSDVYTRFDKAFGAVTAYALILDGAPVGRVVMKHGTAVTAFVQVWGAEMATGRAGGGGYDRGTAAVEAAASKLATYTAAGRPVTDATLARMRDAFVNTPDGTTWRDTLERAGFTLALVIG